MSGTDDLITQGDLVLTPNNIFGYNLGIMRLNKNTRSQQNHSIPTKSRRRVKPKISAKKADESWDSPCAVNPLARWEREVTSTIAFRQLGEAGYTLRLCFTRTKVEPVTNNKS